MFGFCQAYDVSRVVAFSSFFPPVLFICFCSILLLLLLFVLFWGASGERGWGGVVLFIYFVLDTLLSFSSAVNTFCD